MSRPARLLIASLLLFTGHVARAQQSNGDTGAAPSITNAPLSLAPFQPVAPASPDPSAGADSLIPPSQGAPTPGPESLARSTPPAAPSKAIGKTPSKSPSDQPVSKSEIRSMAVQPPPADSPFFIERQEAREAAAKAGREGYGMYVPKPPHPPAGQQVKKFFQGFLGHAKKPGSAGAPAPMTMTVDPSDFSLAQTSELEVSLRVSNARKQEVEFLFPDNQRLEILTKDSAGHVVGRWSEDRAFDRQEGFTEINPEEYVIYAEHITTSRMKAGQIYTIEASLANQEGYTTGVTVTPRP